MAGTKVRGITIELSADASGVNKSLQSVNKNISSTARELKDIDKLLKLDPTNVTLLAQKQEALQRQMENTRNKIKLLKEAEEDLKNQMVDGGTEEQKKQLAALDREIISSERNLQNYTQQMDQAGKETNQLAQSERDAEQATGSMSEGFTVLKGAMASLVADGIRLAADTLKDLITEGPAYADEILTMAQKTTVATDTLQELSYMSDLVDVDVNTVAGSMKKLTKSMDSARSGSGSAADAFKELGVQVTDSNGQLRSSEDVFFDAIESLSNMEEGAERDALAMKIFGKSATELNPMIEAGADKLKDFADEAHEMGYVLDQDALEKLGRVQDAFDRFDRKMTAVKNTVAAGVAPAIERAMRKLQTIVDKIDWEKFGEDLGKAFEGNIDAFEWILNNGDAIKAVLSGIIAAFAAAKIVQVVQGIQKMTTALMSMNTVANANPYVLLISAIVGLGAALVSASQSAHEMYKENNVLIKALTDDMSVIEEHSAQIDEMAAAYDEARQAREETMNAGLAEMAHVQDLTAELATLANQNGEVKKSDQDRAQFILGELNNALGTEYTMTGNVITQYQSMTQAIKDMIEQKKAEIILQAQEEAYRQAILGREQAEQTLAQAIRDKAQAEEDMANTLTAIEQKQAAMNAAAAAGSSAVQGLGFEISMLKQSYNEAEAGLAAYDAKIQTSAEVVDKYAYDITQYEANATKAITGNYQAITNKAYETAKAQGQASSEASKAVTTNTTAAQQQWLKDLGAMVSAATGKKVEFRDAGKGMVQAIVDGQEEGKEVPVGKVRDMARSMVTTFQQANPGFVTSGENVVQGIAQGIANGSGSAYTAMSTLASGLLQEFNRKMEIKSPSRVMMRTARFIDEGIAVGIEKNKGIVFNEMDKLAGQMSQFNPLVSGYQNIGSGSAANGSVSNSFVQNNYSPKALSRLDIYRNTRNLLDYAGRA